MMLRFSHILLASSIGLLASCDKLLPPQRAGAARQPPTAIPPPPPPRKPARPSREAADSEARPLVEQIRFTLRRLVVAEEGFFAENGAYTQDLARLAFRRDGATEINFLWLDRQGWAVRGTHPALPGRDCVVFVGAASEPPSTRRYRLTGKPGVPACDVRSVTKAASADTSPSPRPDTSSALNAVSPTVQMKADLRRLELAQDAYYRMMGTYSRRFETLPIQFGWQPRVDLVMTHADRRSWSARATHSLEPGKSCVVWYGPVGQPPTTEAQGRSPRQAGEPVCDQ
jgi:hypothetical protein